MRKAPSALLLTGLLGTAGTLHFVWPKPFNAIVPRTLPGSSHTWTYVSGAAELGCAIILAHSRTRRTGAALTAALFVAVFPANVKMALDYRDKPRGPHYVAYGRLPLQLPLILWALRIRATN